MYLRIAIENAIEECINNSTGRSNGPPIEICFTGHSLGGALSTLAALDTQLLLNSSDHI